MQEIVKKRGRPAKIKSPIDNVDALIQMQTEMRIDEYQDTVATPASLDTQVKAVVGTNNMRRVFVLVLGVLVFYLGWRYSNYFVPILSSNDIPNTQTGMIVKKVGRLIELPLGEDPTIATVSNLEALKDQPFFANAKLGDIVLIYSSSRKAILYRPDADKLIDVAPFSFSNTPANEEASN